MRPSAKKDNVKLPNEAIKLINSVGEFIEYWGFKAIEGKIWCTLFLSDQPLDATQIRERLHISKGLVSISIKRLLDYKVIEEFGKSTYGTHLYQSSPDLMNVILSVLRLREKKLLEEVHHQCLEIDKLPKKDLEISKIDSNRITMLSEFTEQAHLLLSTLVDTRRGDLESFFNYDSLISDEIPGTQSKTHSKNRSSSSEAGSLH